MTQPLSEKTITQTVEAALQVMVKEEQERCIKAATAEFEKNVRSRVAHTAINLATMYSVERMDHDLVIRVKIDS